MAQKKTYPSPNAPGKIKKKIIPKLFTLLLSLFFVHNTMNENDIIFIRRIHIWGKIECFPTGIVFTVTRIVQIMSCDSPYIEIFYYFPSSLLCCFRWEWLVSFFQFFRCTLSLYMWCIYFQCNLIFFPHQYAVFNNFYDIYALNANLFCVWWHTYYSFWILQQGTKSMVPEVAIDLST